MIGSNDHRPCAGFLRHYQDIVARAHPDLVEAWPLLNGWDLLTGDLGGWCVAVFKDAPYSSTTRQSGVGAISELVAGASTITLENRDTIRSCLERHFSIGPRDAVVLYPPENDPHRDMRPELAAMLQRHKAAMGVGDMRIFLSHKGANKDKVRKFEKTLRLLGFDPWLDENDLAAGTLLDRGILKGVNDSCAVVFFVTPDFKDEKYISAEVDYAVELQRKKGDKFIIITLVFDEGGVKGTVPDLLRRFVWKEPKSELEALDEIIKALPIRVGRVAWR